MAHGIFVALNPTRHFVLHWASIYRACSPKTLSICKVKKKRVTFWDTLVLHIKQCVNYFVFFCPLVLGFLYFSFMASGRLTFIFTFRFLPFFS